jgi:hypothetical protein
MVKVVELGLDRVQVGAGAVSVGPSDHVPNGGLSVPLETGEAYLLEGINLLVLVGVDLLEDGVEGLDNVGHLGVQDLLLSGAGLVDFLKFSAV